MMMTLKVEQQQEDRIQQVKGKKGKTRSIVKI
jgi:hypothetical protein